jgi:hypothetical protein
MTNEQTIEEMKQWCLDHYTQGADTMVECWGTADYEDLFVSLDGTPNTTKQAWSLLKKLAAVLKDRQDDAINSAF